MDASGWLIYLNKLYSLVKTNVRCGYVFARKKTRNESISLERPQENNLLLIQISLNKGI
jgi:hypothetical protein